MKRIPSKCDHDDHLSRKEGTSRPFRRSIVDVFRQRRSSPLPSSPIRRQSSRPMDIREEKAG